MATRSYSLGGQVVAVRTKAALTWLAADHQGTQQYSIKACLLYTSVFNLTVEGIHTYYVLANDTSVLVHNCNRSGDVHLDLNYKDGWDTDQIAAADAKVAHLDDLAGQGQLVKTKAERLVPGSAAQRLRAAGVDVPSGHDGDHLQDLQLGGMDTLENLGPLDGSVNRSLGPQIAGRIRNLPLGSVICGVSISGRC